VPGVANPAPANPLVPSPAIPAPGQTNPPVAALTTATNLPPEETLPAGTINFPATDLNQVLQIYAELVGRTVLRPSSLPAPQITLKTQTPLTRREAVQAFDAVLALNGISIVNVGDKFVKVVPAAQAGQVGAPFSKESGSQLAEMGPFVTYVLQTTNVKPSEVVQALTPFATAGLANGILPIDPSQILVLRDYSENVKRMLEMVKKIDVSIPPEYTQEVIPIKYALASDIANALNSLSSGGGGTSIGAGGAAGGTGAARAGGMRGGVGGVGGAYGRPGTGGYGGYGTTPGAATPFGTTTPIGGVQQPGGSFSQRLQNIINRAAVSGEIQVLGQTKIIADERTNSLLIFASRDDMKMIKEIVAKLDVVLAQVLIEAVIIEVSLNSSTDLGISYLQKQPQPGGNSYFQGIGAINNKNILAPGSFSTIGAAATNTAAALPSGFSYLASLNNDLDVSITALAANSKARILQRPRIQTSHAVPATLFVGESRPYPQGSYYGGGAFGGYSTIQQLQIGVTLSVTPLINPDGLVVMDISQQITSFEGNVTINGVGDVPITSEKDASAKVAVRDHDTIMLGGLIETDKNSNNSGVPLLKDIPILGYLFRSSHADAKRDELIVLIRPTVLPTPEIAALAAKSEKERMPGLRQLEQEIQREEASGWKPMEKGLTPK
jgi:general secretion pathway protein D